MAKARARGPAPEPPSFALPATVSRDALLVRGSDHRFRRLLYDLNHLGELLAQSRQHLAAQFDLTPPQYNILMVVAEHHAGGGVSVADAAAELHVSGAFVTTQVNRLVDRGLLAKQPNPEDGRGVLVVLTALGRSEIQRVAPLIRAFNDRFFRSLSGVGFEQFATIVSELIGSGEHTLLDAKTAARRLSRAAGKSSG